MKTKGIEGAGNHNDERYQEKTPQNWGIFEPVASHNFLLRYKETFLQHDIYHQGFDSPALVVETLLCRIKKRSVPATIMAKLRI